MAYTSGSGAPDRRAVLLTDASARGVLAAARTLAGAGFLVGAAAEVPRAAAYWSVAARGRHATPDPRADPQGFVDALARIGSAGGYRALIPGGDASLRAVSEFRSRLPGWLRLGLPPAPVVEAALDKRHFVALTREVGMPQPRTEICHTVEDAIAAAGVIGYPVVLKPHSTVFLDGRTLQQRSSRIARDRSAVVRMGPEYGAPFLVQECLQGTTYSLAGVVADGALPGIAMARYERTWPPGAGNAAYAITLQPPAEVLRAAQRLLERLNWRGLFELEYLALSDGTLVPIDLNPRPYGSLALASAAGAPLAVLWARMLFGERPEPVAAQPGHRYRWEDADLRNLLWTLRTGRVRAALGAARPRRRTVHAYFSWRDPGPFAARALELSVHAVKTRARGRRRSPPHPSRRASSSEGQRGVPV